jgi:hypothetical protein
MSTFFPGRRPAGFSGFLGPAIIPLKISAVGLFKGWLKAFIIRNGKLYMPGRKYVRKYGARDALKKTFRGGVPKEKNRAKTRVFRVPKELRGIEGQDARERAMRKFIRRLPQAEIERIIDSYGTLSKTADGETFSMVAQAEMLSRKMAGKWGQ